ncbi:hypothetical protein MBLNU457_6552t1 [Dothideomycetes sp. NU457]
MAETDAKPKSILKKKSSQIPLPATLPIPKTDEEKKRLQVAIHHATLIQDQKAIQQQNLDAIEELSDIPVGSESTAQETKRFTSLVIQFQPSDYDALIEERVVNGRCGYTLCPNSARKLEPKMSWARPKGSQNWCSNECAKKALYVKAQLDETPAWERREGLSTIALRPDASSDGTQLPIRTKIASTDASDLAMERGDKITSSRGGLVTDEIVEKETKAPKAPMSVRFDDFAHQEIEGYRVATFKQKATEDDDDD